MEAAAASIPFVPSLFAVLIASFIPFLASRFYWDVLRLLSGSFFMIPWERRLLFCSDCFVTHHFLGMGSVDVILFSGRKAHGFHNSLLFSDLGNKRVF
jgi:hypothetical protein